jgi:diguanylate cyclase (GGDEF)-like protein
MALSSTPRDTDIGVLRRVAVTMLLGGALVCASGLLVLPPEPASDAAHAAVAAALVVTGLAMALLRRRVKGACLLAAFWSIVWLGLLVAFAEPLGSVAYFYLWPVVLVAYYYSQRATLLAFVLMLVSLGVGLAVTDSDVPRLDAFVGTAASVGLMAGLVSMTTEHQARLQRELERVADTDGLTGLHNRRSFDRLLPTMVDEARRRRTTMAVVMFDLDHFKSLNDRHGHLVGDQALQDVAETLRSASREGDVVARFGGEEFIVGLPGATPDSAARYATRVATALAGCGTSVVPVHVSAGIAVSTHEDPAEVLIRRADEALYAAKGAGRCRLATWTDAGPAVASPFV